MKNLAMVLFGLLVVSSLVGLDLPQTGQFSKVTLAAVERTNYIERGQERALYPDGLRFYFLIKRLDPNSGRAALKEVRDFLIDGQSYRRSTIEQIGAVEPNTTFYDLKNLLLKEPQTYHRISGIEDYDYVIKATVCGIALPATGKGSVSLFFGWETQLEKFDYSFDLSEVQREAMLRMTRRQ